MNLLVFLIDESFEYSDVSSAADMKTEMEQFENFLDSIELICQTDT